MKTSLKKPTKKKPTKKLSKSMEGLPAPREISPVIKTIKGVKHVVLPESDWIFVVKLAKQARQEINFKESMTKAHKELNDHKSGKKKLPDISKLLKSL